MSTIFSSIDFQRFAKGIFLKFFSVRDIRPKGAKKAKRLTEAAKRELNLQKPTFIYIKEASRQGELQSYLLRITARTAVVRACEHRDSDRTYHSWQRIYYRFPRKLQLQQHRRFRKYPLLSDDASPDALGYQDREKQAEYIALQLYDHRELSLHHHARGHF